MSLNQKVFALGAAAGLLGFCGAANAQAGNQNWQMAGANTRLDQTINSDSVKPGQAVEAKLDQTVTTGDGVKLDKGTELMGTVSDSAPSAHHGPASVTLQFTKAQLRDGKQIPVKVTLLGAYPAAQGDEATYGQSMIPSAPRHVDAQQTIVQQGSSAELKSSVQGEYSGTFSREDGNFRLSRGTVLQVGIAAQTNNSTTGE